MDTDQIKAELQKPNGQFKSTLDYFNGEAHRALLFLDRYAMRDETGLPVELTYTDTIARLSKAVDSVQISKADAEWLLQDFRFVPGGRILRGLGDEAELTLYNCLTLPRPKDTLAGDGGILDIARQLAIAQKKGAGVGFRIDSLRPEGSQLKSSKGVASGPVSFLHLYDAVTSVIKQGGSRRGATLIAMSATHPDIFRFIKVKQSDALLSNMNISVICTDAFMQAVCDDKKIELDWDGGTAHARKIFEALIENAHATGDPGIIFEDAMIRNFSTQNLGHPFELVNACSEIPLPAYGVCLLGSINLMQCVTGGLGKGGIDFEQLGKITRLAVRFLDMVIDLGGYPLPQCEEVQKATRRLGIGVMGLAHALIWCGKRYDSQEGQELTQKIFKYIKDAAWAESSEIAFNYGIFPAAKNSGGRVRNSALLACPPTGTISQLAGVSAGIEPVFFGRMQRKDGLGEYEQWDPIFKLWQDKHPDKPYPSYFQTAHDILPQLRVKMQAAIQKHIDNAISSTVNLPHSATIEDVVGIYTLSWESGCKSITVYRDGSRRDAPIVKEALIAEERRKKSNQQKSLAFCKNSKTFRIPYQSDDKLYIHISYDEQRRPLELFLNTKCIEHTAWINALMIIISKHLQNKLTLEELIADLKSIVDPSGGTWFTFPGDKKSRYIASGPAALGLVLEYFLRDDKQAQSIEEKRLAYSLCPRCKQYTIIYQEGCETCTDTACGYNRC